MVFQAIPSKFSCATFQKPSNTSYFVQLFLAHEDVVDGFVIFHTKLSTPQLGSFICSSLFWQGSWSNHYNLKKKKKEKKALLQWNVKVGRYPMELVSHGLRKEKGGEECKAKRAPMCQLIKHLGTALTCLVWKISRTPLLVVDKSNHLSK
jgi:hypothetical protein